MLTKWGALLSSDLMLLKTEDCRRLGALFLFSESSQSADRWTGRKDTLSLFGFASGFGMDFGLLWESRKMWQRSSPCGKFVRIGVDRVLLLLLCFCLCGGGGGSASVFAKQSFEWSSTTKVGRRICQLKHSNVNIVRVKTSSVRLALAQIVFSYQSDVINRFKNTKVPKSVWSF